MASNHDLEKDEIIGRAAALRGVSPEKFIEDVRRISSGRGMCAHSREYFFRPSNVRTLDAAARLKKEACDDVTVAKIDRLERCVGRLFESDDNISRSIIKLVDVCVKFADDIFELKKRVAELDKEGGEK